MPTNQSIWTRPIGPRFWMWSCGTCLCLILCLAAYPTVASTFTWLGHRSVTYRGGNIPLPFRWVYDQSGLPLSIEKPSSRWLFDSSLFITKHDLAPSDVQKKLDTFSKMGDSLHEKYPAGKAPHAFIDTAGQPLFCSEDPTPKFITMQCISRNGVWLFNYLGNAEDAHEVNASVQYILEHERDFR